MTEDVYAKVQEKKHSQAMSLSRVPASFWKSAETNIVVRKAPILKQSGRTVRLPFERQPGLLQDILSCGRPNGMNASFLCCMCFLSSRMRALARKPE